MMILKKVHLIRSSLWRVAILADVFGLLCERVSLVCVKNLGAQQKFG